MLNRIWNYFDLNRASPKVIVRDKEQERKAIDEIEDPEIKQKKLIEIDEAMKLRWYERRLSWKTFERKKLEEEIKLMRDSSYRKEYEILIFNKKKN